MTRTERATPGGTKFAPLVTRAWGEYAKTQLAHSSRELAARRVSFELHTFAEGSAYHELHNFKTCQQGEQNMAEFAIIEVEDGLTMVELPPGAEPVEVAEQHGGVLVDRGPYNFEEATDVLTELEIEPHEEAD